MDYEDTHDGARGCFAQYLRIGKHIVGPGNPAFIIAEVAQTHDGSLGLAHSFVDAIADTGANAVKFQTHIASAESSPMEPFRVPFSYEDSSRYGYWVRTGFTEDQWIGLAEHARKRGLVFLSSPFSVEAVRLLARLHMDAWKIGSGEIGNDLLLKAVLEETGPCLVSTGLGTMSEVERTVERLRAAGREFALLQCTSMYPTPLEKVGLNVLESYKRFNCPLGVSDHSGTLFPGLAALARGYRILEVHATFSRSMFGPDVSSSLTMEEVSFLVEAAKAFATMDLIVDKDEIIEGLKDTRTIFDRSLCAIRDLSRGSAVAEGDLAALKPGGGIPVSEINTIIGRRLRVAVASGHRFSWEDFDGGAWT